MLTLLRVLLAFALMAMIGIAEADQEVAVFAAAVEKKLSQVAGNAARPDATVSDESPEQTVLVDVNSDGSVVRVQDRAPVADKAASAKLHRLIRMASPFPKLPTSLSIDYSAIRLAIVYVVGPDRSPSGFRVEIRGGFKYVDF